MCCRLFAPTLLRSIRCSIVRGDNSNLTPTSFCVASIVRSWRILRSTPSTLDLGTSRGSRSIITSRVKRKQGHISVNSKAPMKCSRNRFADDADITNMSKKYNFLLKPVRKPGLRFLVPRSQLVEIILGRAGQRFCWLLMIVVSAIIYH